MCAWLARDIPLSIPIETSLKEDLKYAFNISMLRPVEFSRLLDVHPSQLPICPTEFILDWINLVHNGCTSYTLRDSITLDIGTTVHRCFQNCLPAFAGSRMLGDWKCNKCGHMHQFCIKPHECIICKSNSFTYEELPIKYKGFAGHIDTIYKTDTGVAIVDYKTATLSNFKEKADNPGISYQSQIRAYALLVKLQYKLVCTDAFLVFIAKEKPAPENIAIYHEKITKQKLHDTFLFLQHQRSLKRQLLSIKTFDEFIKLKPEPCMNPYCKACKDHKESLRYIKEHWNSDLFPIADYIQEKLGGLSIQSN